MTSFTLCTIISLIHTHLLACGHPYVSLLPANIFSLQKQRTRIITRTLILSRRQKGPAFTRAGGFIAVAGHYSFYGDSGFALLALCCSSSTGGAPQKMVGATSFCHSMLTQFTITLQLLTFTDHDEPWSIHWELWLYTSCRICHRMNGTYTSIAKFHLQ